MHCSPSCYAVCLCRCVRGGVVGWLAAPVVETNEGLEGSLLFCEK